MIQFPRSVARKFRAMFRKIALAGSPAPPLPSILLNASRDGLEMRAQSAQIALEYDLSGQYAPEQLAVRIDALERFEGRDDSPVSLEASSSDKVVARWTDSGTPQVSDFEAVDPKTLLGFPSRPEEWAANSAELLRALCDASDTADESSVKYALDMIQLCGKAGSVTGTDGRQLYIHSGFSFPFTDDILIPRVPFFRCRELGEGPNEIGVTEKYVAFRVAPWTFHLRIEKERRFPKVNSIIPDKDAALATLSLSPEDADFLAETLKRLPAHDDPDSPVTIDCNTRVAVRAAARDQKTTELVLARSQVLGQKVCCASNRTYLARALEMGFREFRLFGAGSITHSMNGDRQYLWMGLAKDAIVPAADDVVRISSEEVSPTPGKSKNGKKASNTPPASNGKTSGRSPSKTADKKGVGIAAVIAEAQALRSVLRDAYRQSSQLVLSLKRHRKQAKLMRSTIAALRQLAPREQ